MEKILTRIKFFSYGVIGISTIAFISLLLVSLKIAISAHEKCPGFNFGCTLIGHIPIESFFGMVALIILTGAGIFIVFSINSAYVSTVKLKTQVKKTIKSLEGDEKKIYDFIVAKGGAAFQSDIIKELGYSKVRVTRLIDKLELKGIVERRRRGMSNIIVLKPLFSLKL